MTPTSEQDGHVSTPDHNAYHSPPDPSAELEPLLLLSGSGLRPWIWDAFVNQLPTGTPVGIAPRPLGDNASLASYVEQAIAAAPAERFTIVAHSLGAIVGLATAAAAPERVTGLVAVAGVVPNPPGSFLTAMPLPNRWLLSIAMRIAGTRPPDKTIRRSLTAGLAPAVADRIVEEFELDPQQIFRSRIARTGQPERRGYVSTSNDAEMPTKLQRRFIEALAPQWTTTVDTGHLPMLEDPPGLAAAILDFHRTPAIS